MRLVKNICKYSLMSVGTIALMLIILAFSDLPYLAYHHLGTKCDPLGSRPDVIVVLGGSGMPSADGLIRTYYAANAAMENPATPIIIAHPKEKSGQTHQLGLMANELVIRGIDRNRIQYEPLGYNTRSQAINVAEMLGHDRKDISVLIITTPEHMYRSIRSFEKVGFDKVGGLPSFEMPISEIDLRKTDGSQETGLAWRYNVWSYLKYEILVLREYCAIAYYRLKGWI
jgi:uncharacterized SAM-binding protein YcdF (DUF218 family)